MRHVCCECDFPKQTLSESEARVYTMEMNEANILIVDDNPGVLSAGKLFLKRHFAEVDTTREPEEIPGFL